MSLLENPLCVDLTAPLYLDLMYLNFGFPLGRKIVLITQS